MTAPAVALAFALPQDAMSAPKQSAGAVALKATKLVIQARDKSERAELKALGVDVDEINRPWQIVAKALADRFGVADTKFVQFASNPQPADWNDAKFGPYRTSFYGDAMPRWGATFDPQTGSSFADVYGTFINAIALKLGSPADQAQADNARTKWNTCNIALQNQYKQIGPHWESFNKAQMGLPPSKRMVFDVWFARFEAPGLQTQQGKCNGLAVTYNAWFNKATAGQAGLANAIQRYSQAVQVTAAVPGSDLYESVWPYAFVQSLPDFVAASDAKPTPDFDQTFDNKSGTYSATTSTWGGSASYGWFFRASAGGSSSTLDTHDSAFKMRVTMKGLQAFDLRPSGGWYSQQLVQFFRHGPFIPGSMVEQRDAAGTLYGKDGLFSLRSARFIVAYKPRIEITMSQKDYHEAKSSWSGSAGFGIGAFSFGGGGGGSKTDITWNDATNTMVAEDSSNVPKIVAVIDDVLPDFQ